MLDFNDEETYLLILKAGKEFGVDPSSSMESEIFFQELIAQYLGNLDDEEILTWLTEQIRSNFIAVGGYPKWIQGSEWPFANGKPMIFVGQIDLFAQERKIIDMYHDDTSLFIFIGNKVQPVVITQQF